MPKPSLKFDAPTKTSRIRLLAFLTATSLSACDHATPQNGLSSLGAARTVINPAGVKVTVYPDVTSACPQGIPDRSGNTPDQIVASARSEFYNVNSNASRTNWPADFHNTGVTDSMKWIKWTSPMKGLPVSQWPNNYGRTGFFFDDAMGGHEGEDLSHSYNVLAAADGEVVYVLNHCQSVTDTHGWNIGRLCGSAYGNQVVIRHTDQYGMPTNVYTRSAHLAAANVKVGQKVQRGDFVGTMGTTGWSDGDHLHFEVGVHEGSYPRCGMPIVFNKGVYRPKKVLSSSHDLGRVQLQVMGKKCTVSAGGDSITVVRSEAKPNASQLGTVNRGSAAYIRGWIGDWASVQVVLTDGQEVGAHLGKRAFIYWNQLNLANCK